MDYLSAIIYSSMILNFNELVNGSSLLLPAHGRAGARATPFLAALFAKQKTKFGGGTPVVENFVFTTGQEARAGKNSWWTSTLQPPSFLPARAKFFQKSASGFSRKKVRILFRRHSSYFLPR